MSERELDDWIEALDPDDHGYDVCVWAKAEIVQLRAVLSPLAHCGNKVWKLVSAQTGQQKLRDCGYCGGCEAAAVLRRGLRG